MDASGPIGALELLEDPGNREHLQLITPAIEIYFGPREYLSRREPEFITELGVECPDDAWPYLRRREAGFNPDLPSYEELGLLGVCLEQFLEAAAACRGEEWTQLIEDRNLDFMLERKVQVRHRRVDANDLGHWVEETRTLSPPTLFRETPEDVDMDAVRRLIGFETFEEPLELDMRTSVFGQWEDPERQEGRCYMYLMAIMAGVKTGRIGECEPVAPLPDIRAPYRRLARIVLGSLEKIQALPPEIVVWDHRIRDAVAETCRALGVKLTTVARTPMVDAEFRRLAESRKELMEWQERNQAEDDDGEENGDD
jgi:hypothetical protein